MALWGDRENSLYTELFSLPGVNIINCNFTGAVFDTP